MNLPNKLTILRVLMIPFFLWVLLAQLFGEEWFQIAAAGIFLLASMTDMLDGYIARKHNLITNFGKFMDPLADKLLVCAALIALVEMGRLPAWMVIVLISREFIVVGFRMIAAEKNIVIAADIWGKIKTSTQMLMIVLLILNNPMPVMQHMTQATVILSVAFSVISATEMLYKNKDVLKES